MLICKTFNCRRKCGAGKFYCGTSPCKELEKEGNRHLKCRACANKTTKGYYCHACVTTRCLRYVCIKCASWFPDHDRRAEDRATGICFKCDHSPFELMDVAHSVEMIPYIGTPW